MAENRPPPNMMDFGWRPDLFLAASSKALCDVLKTNHNKAAVSGWWVGQSRHCACQPCYKVAYFH